MASDVSAPTGRRTAQERRRAKPTPGVTTEHDGRHVLLAGSRSCTRSVLALRRAARPRVAAPADEKRRSGGGEGTFHRIEAVSRRRLHVDRYVAGQAEALTSLVALCEQVALAGLDIGTADLDVTTDGSPVAARQLPGIATHVHGHLQAAVGAGRLARGSGLGIMTVSLVTNYMDASRSPVPEPARPVAA